MYTEIIKRMKKINLRYQIAAGVILVICGTLVLLSDYIKDKRDVVFSEMNLALSSMNMDDSLNNQDENIDNVEENKGENPNYTYEEYLGIIDISKINLYKGFYNKDSNLNNVKFNLYVLPESNYPDIKGGNLIIAGHSGNYNNSYFANLYKLMMILLFIIIIKNMYIKLIRYIMKKRLVELEFLEIRIILRLHLLLVQRMIIIIKRYILHI